MYALDGTVSLDLVLYLKHCVLDIVLNNVFGLRCFLTLQFRKRERLAQIRNAPRNTTDDQHI